MDPEINELKELVRQNIALTQENNQMLHSMKRSARWSAILRIIWWLTIIGVTGALYYYFFIPYLTQIYEIYNNAQQTLQSFQGGGLGR